MAAGTFTFYDTAASVLADDGDVTVANALRVALVGSTYTPGTGHSLWSQVSAHEISSTSTGYTTGGQTISSPVLTDITAGVKFSSAALQWTAGASNLPTWKYAVFYFAGTVAGRTAPVVGYFEGESGSTVPATTASNTLTITPNAAGWFDITHA